MMFYYSVLSKIVRQMVGAQTLTATTAGLGFSATFASPTVSLIFTLLCMHVGVYRPEGNSGVEKRLSWAEASIMGRVGPPFPMF